MAVRQGNTEGTFSGTGQSDAIRCTRADVSLDFAGTATVEVQRARDGTSFKTIESHTADTEKTYEAGSVQWIRLNCSAHTDNVTYSITSDGEW